MRFQEKLGEYSKEELWNEYCGFLDLSIDEYMKIQKRLLTEQIELWSKSKLGQTFLKGKYPKTIEEFRQLVPLTTYEDYAQSLLGKQKDILPSEPILWIQTTWEGGVHPIKVAPYTKGMLDTYKHNVIACLIMTASNKKKEFDVSVTDHILYALAPLPYATGLLPLLLKDEIDIEFLPPVKDAVALSFKERNILGFKQGMRKGIEYFFGLGSVAYYVSNSISSMQKSSSNVSLWKKLFSFSPRILVRYLKARKKCKKENRDLMPKDLFQLKGFMCAGTDNRCYKDDLERLWGVRPMELFAGTEPTLIGTETWSREGMYFFPDACFYEFIPERELEKSYDNPGYQPSTVLMNQVVPGGVYEIVLTVLKGGAFVRYRVGDVYRCTGIGNPEEGIKIPRFAYVDRVPQVIDIAGFTRITENSIQHALNLSGLQIKDWTAKKEYNEQDRPLMHLYVEMDRHALTNSAISLQILQEHLSIYFKYLDQDYGDLKKILGIDPLKISLLKCGTFDAYRERFGRSIRKMNPESCDLNELMICHESVHTRKEALTYDWV